MEKIYWDGTNALASLACSKEQKNRPYDSMIRRSASNHFEGERKDFKDCGEAVFQHEGWSQALASDFFLLRVVSSDSNALKPTEI